jgi:hypothetical protein
MKTLALVKIGLVLALGAATLPGLCATSTIAFARGDGGGGGGGGGAAGGGGGGSEGGGGGSVLVPPADNSPPRNPPGRNPPGRGATVLRETDRALPGCIDYGREVYGLYGVAIPLRCQSYLRFYDED